MVGIVAQFSHKMEALHKETQQREAASLQHLMLICLNFITIPKQFQSNYTLKLLFYILQIVTVDYKNIKLFSSKTLY